MSNKQDSKRESLHNQAIDPDYTDELVEAYAKSVNVDPRPMETKHEIDDRGAFVRQPNSFIRPFGEEEGDLKAEAGRYRIYWAKGCNWSIRPVITRDLLGLEQVIGDQYTSFSGQSNRYGHGFGDQAGHKDPATGAYFLSEFYKRADPSFTGRATTPTLVDIIEKKAVNNDYHRLTNYIEVQFRPFQPKDAPDLYPKEHRDQIDAFNDWLFPHINNSHYRMAFGQSLSAYNEAFDDFYTSLDKLEKRLETNRFLFGDYVTDSDIRFFVTLARWDLSYFRNIGPVKQRIVDYKNIWAYAKELYSIPAFKKNSFLKEQTEARYPRDKNKGIFVNWTIRIASQIDFDELWADDGSRARLSRTPEEKFLRHPEDERPEDYLSPISVSKWNSPEQSDRDPSNPDNSKLSVDASVNPLK